MTDQELAKKVRDATAVLNDAISDAYRAGLDVDVEIENENSITRSRPKPRLMPHVMRPL